MVEGILFFYRMVEGILKDYATFMTVCYEKKTTLKNIKVKERKGSTYGIHEVEMASGTIWRILKCL